MSSLAVIGLYYMIARKQHPHSRLVELLRIELQLSLLITFSVNLLAVWIVKNLKTKQTNKQKNR